MIIYDVYNANYIGDSGAISIGEVLKFNSTLTKLSLSIQELIMYDWELNDDMNGLWLFMMYIMGIILEIQEEVWLGRDWRSIQHLHHCIWAWLVNKIWLRISWWYDWFMIIYDEYNVNNIGDSGASGIGEGLKVNSTLTELSLGMKSL